MPGLSLDTAEKIPKKTQLRFIKILKDRIKNHKTIKKVFDKYNLDVNEIDLVPVAFAELDVSARTDHGIIYLSYNLLTDGSFINDDHYLVHELVHYAQQTTGDKPTKSSDDGDYLANKYEQEGFRGQTEYIADMKGDDKAEEYIDKVLDHHDVKEKGKREKRKDQLLSIARNHGL